MECGRQTIAEIDRKSKMDILLSTDLLNNVIYYNLSPPQIILRSVMSDVSDDLQILE